MVLRRAAFAFSIALVASIFAAAAATAALAHDASISTVRGHLEEDSVSLSPAAERRLKRHTRAASVKDSRAAAAAVSDDPGQVGQWGPVSDWPVVGVHAALLPNGKVLAYDSMGDHAT